MLRERTGRGSRGNAAELAYDQLVQRVRTLPVPTVPPRYPYLGTSVGVGLLDAAINLDHVVRRIEQLKIVDLAHVSRDVTLHLSLDRLTPPQRTAAQEYRERRERAGLSSERSPILWVPITRVNRLFASPVRIFDNEGREVPRATQPELLPLINAAMYRLLRLELLGQAEPQRSGGDDGRQLGSGSVHQVLYERDRARWLLQEAVASMIYDTYQVRSSGRHPRGDESDPDRQAALEVIEDHLQPDGQAAFLELLHHASTEYLILAGLTSGKKEHYLSYNAAALPSRPPHWRSMTSLRGLWRGLSPLGCEFTLRYETQLPSNLESFHVTVEAEGETRVREAVLLTDHDRGACGAVQSRLDRAADPKAGLPESILRHQVGIALLDLANLVDGRMNDSDGYLMQFEHRHPRRGPLSKRPVPSRALRKLNGQLGAVGYDRLRAGRYEPDIDIARLARTVKRLDLADASVMDDDPRGHVAHMFWHRRLPHRRPGSAGDATADVRVVVADQRSPLSRSIVAWLSILLGLVAVMGALIFGRFGWRFPDPRDTAEISDAFHAREPSVTTLTGIQSDALIAVLLVVPGWLLLQLEGLPTKRSLRSRLRMLESFTGVVAIVATAGLALVVATRADDVVLVYRSFLGVLTALLLLLLISGAERWASARKERRSRLDLLNPPRWLARPSRLRHPFMRGTRAFDAEFESVAQWAAMSQPVRTANVTDLGSKAQGVTHA